MSSFFDAFQQENPPIYLTFTPMKAIMKDVFPYTMFDEMEAKA